MAVPKVKSLYQTAYQPSANQPLHLDSQKRRAFCLPVSSSLAEIGSNETSKNITQVCGVKEQCASIQLRAKMEADFN